MASSLDASIVSAISVGFFSLLGAFVSYSTACLERDACVKAGSCVSAGNQTCSFTNYVSASGWRSFNHSNEIGSLADLTKGWCAPGERLNRNAITGYVECAPRRCYPNAIEDEIMQPGALNWHQKACGEWIDAKTVTTTQSWAFYDTGATAAVVEHAEAMATAGARLQGGDLGKFRGACERMLLGNAVGPAATLAYNYLKSELVTPETVTSVPQALFLLGQIAGHYCDAPVSLGIALGGSSGFSATIDNGVLLSDSALSEALSAVGETDDLREGAVEFAKAMEEAEASFVSTDDGAVVYSGAVSGTRLEALWTTTVTAQLDLPLVYLGKFKTAIGLTSAQAAAEYVHGLAAYCAFASRTAVEGDVGDLSLPARSPALRQRRKIRTDEPKASALGRLQASNELLAEATAENVRQANRITISRLGVDSAATTTSAVARCLRIGRQMFADEVDHANFDLLVTDRLYDRLKTLANTMRERVKHTFSTHVAFNALLPPHQHSQAVAKLDATRLRIAGAPRGTWAGASREWIPAQNLASRDGALVILLKQARAVWIDRHELVVDPSADVCDAPPIYDSLSRNAYLFLGRPCAVILTGLVTPPFAGERYDDASLQSRMGWILAHEFSHSLGRHDTTYWNETLTAELLKDYKQYQYTEGVADLLASAAIVDPTAPGGALVDNSTLCTHVSQLWCARTPPVHIHLEGTHPPENARGDHVCDFLQLYFN